MALNTIGWLVTFSNGGTTTAGIVIGKPSTTEDRVAFGFRAVSGDRFSWPQEVNTTATTAISGSV